MGVQLDDGYLRASLERAVYSDDPAEKRAHQDQLLTYLYESETFETWARGLANHYGRPNDWEDLLQVISETLMLYVRSMSVATFEALDRVAAHLYFKAKGAVRQFLDSPAITVASEMSGISRRYRQAMVARGAFVTEFNRQPSDRELVEYINTKMLARRKDAYKQGVLVSESDISGHMLHAYSMDHQLTEGGDGDMFGTPTQDDTVRGRGELAMTVRRLAELADEQFGEVSNPTVREVLGVWMDFVLDNEPPTITAIAGKFNIDRPRARERMHQVEAVLATMRGDQQPS